MLALGGLGFAVRCGFVRSLLMRRLGVIADLVLIMLGQLRNGMLLAGIEAQCKDGGDQRKDFHEARKLAREARLPSVSLRAAKAATRGGSFVHDDLGKAGQLRGKFRPEPDAHIFDGRIFEAGDFVEVGMVEHVEQRLHRAGNIRVIVEPAGLRIGLALDADLQLEAVPVHPAALVALGRGRQSLRGLKLKILGKSESHPRI